MLSPLLITLFVLDLVFIVVAVVYSWTPAVTYAVIALFVFLVWGVIWYALSTKWGIQRIMITRPAVAVIFLAFFAGSVSLIFATHLLVYTAVFISTSLLLIFVWSLISTAGLFLKREHRKLALVGQALDVKITLINKSRWPRFMVIGFDYFPAVSRDAGYQEMCFVSVRGGSEVSLTYEAVPTLRGDWRVGPFYFWGGDPFGFFKHERLVEHFTELIVLPVPFKITLDSLDSVSQRIMDEAATIPSPGESVEFLGVREYREGDSLRKIHWLSSAKTNVLITKQFEQNVASTLSFLLINTPEMSKGDDPEHTPLEDSLRMIISLAQAAVRQGYQVSFTQLGSGEERDYRVGTGQSFFSDLMLYIARIGEGQPVSLKDELKWIAALVPPDSSLMVFAPEVSERDEELYRHMQSRFRQISVVNFDLESYREGKSVSRYPRKPTTGEILLYCVEFGDDLKWVTEHLLRIGRRRQKVAR